MIPVGSTLRAVVRSDNIPYAEGEAEVPVPVYEMPLVIAGWASKVDGVAVELAPTVLSIIVERPTMMEPV